MSIATNPFMSSIFTLGVLTGLYPALFFLSRNWFILGVNQSIYLLIALVVSAFLAIFFAWATLRFTFFLLTVNGGDAPEHGDPWRLSKVIENSVLAFLSFYILLGYFDFTLREFQKDFDSINLRTFGLSTVAIALFLYIAASIRVKQSVLDPIRLINTLLVVLAIFAAGNFAISVTQNYDKVFSKPESKQNGEIAIYENVEFEVTPNIYLIIPDSYPSNYVLKKFFAVDNTDFTNQLRQLGFTIYDNYYSSYPTSLESIHSMLSMSHNYFDSSIGYDAANLREVIAGKDNNVIDILYRNDYETVFVHETNYLFKGHCYVDRCLPGKSDFEQFLNNLRLFYFFKFTTKKQKYDIKKAIGSEIEKTKPDDRKFIYKHFLASHSGVKSYDERISRLVPAMKAVVPERLLNANAILLEEINQIQAQDDTAIIIVAGDHGTWAGTERTIKGHSTDEILDKFSVLLAIRWGPEYDGKYDKDIKSSVNLFRYIFAFLSQDRKILATKEPDDSYFKHNGVWKVIEDGEVALEPKQHKAM